jgi:hypothetical protein
LTQTNCERGGGGRSYSTGGGGIPDEIVTPHCTVSFTCACAGPGAVILTTPTNVSKAITLFRIIFSLELSANQTRGQVKVLL